MCIVDKHVISFVMAFSVLFRRQHPKLRELQVPSARNTLPMWELMEDLKLEFITGIEGCSGDDISPFFETIELLSLKSLVYEVEGFPTESDGEDNVNITNLHSTDKFEKTVWEDVFQFLLTSSFPASKISKKSKENFSRRCRLWYSLGAGTATGPAALFFTSSGRGKTYGANPTLHPNQLIDQSLVH